MAMVIAQYLRVEPKSTGSRFNIQYEGIVGSVPSICHFAFERLSITNTSIYPFTSTHHHGRVEFEGGW